MDLNLFFARWYELLAYFEGFSDDLFNQSLYISIGLCMVLIPIVFLTLYYYAVDSVKFSKWWHWLILIVVFSIVNFIISYSTTYSELSYLYEQQNKELPYTIEFFSFSFVNAIWTLVVSFIWSMIVKWRSKNCRRTPF